MKSQASGIWFNRHLQITLESHWIERLGTARADRVSESALTFAVKAPSASPDVLDGDNEEVLRNSGRLYQTLQPTVPFWVDGELVQLTGAHRGDQIDVRQIGAVTAPSCVDPGQCEVVSQNSLARAAASVPVLAGFPEAARFAARTKARRTRRGHTRLVARRTSNCRRKPAARRIAQSLPPGAAKL